MRLRNSCTAAVIWLGFSKVRPPPKAHFYYFFPKRRACLSYDLDILATSFELVETAKAALVDFLKKRAGYELLGEE